MPRFQTLLATLRLAGALLTSCADGNSGTPSTIGTQSETGTWDRVFLFIPPDWINTHSPAPTGPILYYFDFDTMATDLDLPDVSGSASRQAKLPFITGLPTQGLPFTPAEIDPMAADAFGKWGWDVADLSQAVFVPDLNVSVLLGSFSGEGISEALATAGYSSEPEEDFVVYSKDATAPLFAVSRDVILVALTRSELSTVLNQGKDQTSRLVDNPDVRSLLPLAQSSHGFILAASGDLQAMADRIELLPPFADLGDARPREYGWRFMLVSFQSGEGSTRMKIVYSYPTDADAANDVTTVRDTLTNTPSFRVHGLKWSDLMSLTSLASDGSLVVADATAPGDNFVGASFTRRDYYGFLPARLVLASTPEP